MDITKIIVERLCHFQKDNISHEIYEYGLEVFILNSINIISIMIISYLSNTLNEGIIFLITFIIIRQLTGGFHFKSYYKCIVSFMLLYLGYLILRKIVRFHFINYILFFLIDSIVIINNSPIENNNKPLRKELIERLKVKTVYILLLFLMLGFIFYQYANTLLYVVSLDTFLIIICKIPGGNLL